MGLIIDRDYPVDYRGEELYKVTVKAGVLDLPWSINETAEKIAEQLRIEALNKGIKVLHVKVWVDWIWTPPSYIVTVEYIGALPTTASLQPTTMELLTVIVIALSTVFGFAIHVWDKNVERTTPVKEYTPEIPGECDEGYAYDKERNKCVRTEAPPPPPPAPWETLITLAIAGVAIYGITSILGLLKEKKG